MPTLISASTLSMLRCPETRQTLVEATAAQIEKLNLEIANGTLKNRSGHPVTRKLDGGLIREDRSYLYPIVDRIPILLTDESISLAETN